jgi:hypothetical protein
LGVAQRRDPSSPGAKTAVISEDERRFHARRPAVSLDQWVWIRLAQAQLGRPDLTFHADVLAAVRDASVDGVALPLSSTHYGETL